jgi:hypothetical protein
VGQNKPPKWATLQCQNQEESRILQVSIFETLQNNLSTVDFSLLMLDVVAIADEVDSQLKQTIISFTGQSASA